MAHQFEYEVEISFFPLSLLQPSMDCVLCVGYQFSRRDAGIGRARARPLHRRVRVA